MLDALKRLTGFKSKETENQDGKKFVPGQESYSRIGDYSIAPSWNEYAPDEVIRDAYHSSYYFSACTDAIVDAVASVPLKVYTRDTTDNWEHNETHPYQTFLDYPNEFITRRMLMERISGHLIFWGNAYWNKNYVNGALVELWPLDPLKVSIIPHKTKFIDKYVYGRGQKAKKFNPEEIVHFKRTNYENLYYGEGQVRALQKLIDLDKSMLDWNKVMIENRGIFPGIIGVKQRITSEQREDLRTELRKKRLRGGEHAGEELIVGSDVTYHRVGMTAEEMDWLASRKLTRQDISMIMRVPLPMVSIYDDATLANVGNARKIFWQDRIIPFLRNIEDAINLTITPDFGERGSLYAEFDYSGIQAVRDEMFEQAKVANILVRLGWQPRALNRHLGMGYREEDIVEGTLVNTINAVGTAAGTREVSTTASESTDRISSKSKSYLKKYIANNVEKAMQEEKEFYLSGKKDPHELVALWVKTFSSCLAFSVVYKDGVSSEDTNSNSFITKNTLEQINMSLKGVVNQKRSHKDRDVKTDSNLKRGIENLYTKWSEKRSSDLVDKLLERMLRDE